MTDEQKEKKSTGSNRSTGLVLVFQKGDGKPVPTPHEHARDRLDRLGLELRGLRAAYAAALEQFAVTAPDDTLKQEARTTARQLRASFNTQAVLLDLLLKP